MRNLVDGLQLVVVIAHGTRAQRRGGRAPAARTRNLVDGLQLAVAIAHGTRAQRRGGERRPRACATWSTACSWWW